MKYYLLQIISDNTLYLQKDDNCSYSIKDAINPFCFFSSDIDIISIISLWKNINQTTNTNALIYEMDFKEQSNKRLLLENEILEIEERLFLNNSLIDKELLIIGKFQKTETYYKLKNIFHTDEHSLLENSINQKTQDSQLSFIKHLLSTIKDDKTLSPNFLEIGTHKGYFGYILSQLYGNCTLHTIDINKESAKVVPILNDVMVFTYFILGDSKKVLQNYDIEKSISMVWIDGGSSYDDTMVNLENILKFKPKYIAINNVKYFSESVRPAYLNFLKRHPEYKNFHNAFWDDDDAGIACCKLNHE